MKSFRKTKVDGTSLEQKQFTKDVNPASNKKTALKWVAVFAFLALLLTATTYAGYKYAKSEDKKAEVDTSKTEEVKKDSKDEKRIVILDLVGPDSGGYKVEKPTDWVTGSCEDNPDIFFLAPTSDLLGKCQTEYFGTVSVSKIEGDVRRTEEYYAADDYYTSPAFTAVTVDGLPGYRVSYSIALESELGYPPVGTFEYFYNLYDAVDNVTYKIGYRELPSDTDYQPKFIEIAESFRRI